MTRRITYANQLAISLFALQDQKEFMIELAQVTGAILGTSTLLNGFACTPTSPVSLSVNVGPGTIFTNQNVDNTPFGTVPSQIPADTADQIVKLAYTLNPPQNFPITPPVTVGYSRNDLVEISFTEADGALTSVPFFQGIGIPPFFQTVNVLRIDSVVITVKPGIAAPTGTQATPSPDAGYVGVWVITTAQGQVSIGSGDIALYPGAPFITETLTQKISLATGDARYARIGQFAFQSGVVNGNMIVAQRQVLTLVNNTPGIGLVDAMMGEVAAVSLSSGTLTQATGLSYGSTGTALWFDSISAVNPQIITTHRIESNDSLPYNTNVASVSCIVYQDTGSVVPYTFNIAKANALNDFTTTTSIVTSTTINVPSGVATPISFVNQTLGNVTNGIQITVTANASALTLSNNNFYLTDLCLNSGPTAITFVPQEYTQALKACQRRYQKSYEDGIASGTPGYVLGSTFTVSANATNSGVATISVFIQKMIYAPTVNIYSPLSGTLGFIESAASGGHDVAATTNDISTHSFAIENSATTDPNSQHSAHWEAIADL